MFISLSRAGKVRECTVQSSAELTQHMHVTPAFFIRGGRRAEGSESPAKTLGTCRLFKSLVSKLVACEHSLILYVLSESHF